MKHYSLESFFLALFLVHRNGNLCEDIRLDLVLVLVLFSYEIWLGPAQT